MPTAIFSFVLSTCILVALHHPFLANAATTSTKSAQGQSASPSASPEETTLELKKRIEKVVEEKRDQVKGVISNLLSDKRGFIGEVSRLSQEALTIKQNEDTTILPLTPNITILRRGRKISAEDIAVGNWVTVIGLQNQDKFTPEFIIVSETTLRPKPKTVLIGTITEIGRTTFTVTPRGSETAQEFIIPKTVKYENTDGSALKITDFEEDIAVLIVGRTNDSDKLELSTVRALTDVRATR